MENTSKSKSNQIEKDEIPVKIAKPNVETVPETVEMRLREDKRRHNAVLKEKIMAVTKMLRVFKMIRAQNNNIAKLKSLLPSGQLPIGILRKGSGAIENALNFAQATVADVANEKLPLRPGRLSLPLPESRGQLKFRNASF